MSSSTILLLIAAIIVAIGLALGQYFTGKRPRKWGVYAGLRSLTYFCIFLLLINPKIKQQRYSVEKPSLVIAVDNSRSIGEFGEQQSVIDFVNNLQSNEKIKEAFDVEAYTFGAAFNRQDSLDFSEGQTQIDVAFSNLEKLYKSQTAPTLLITDGNQTMGRDYEYSAKRYGQDIYPVVVGDTTQYPDIRIDRLHVNRYAFLHNKFPVEIFISYTGDEAVSRTFTLQEKGQIRYQKTLEFDADHNAQIISAELEALQVGMHTYTAKIEALTDEKNIENNQQDFGVEVIDEKTNILLLSAFPHPDLGSFKKSIESNQQRKVNIHYTQDSDIDFGHYQLVILYQPDQSFSKAFDQINKLGLNRLIVTGTKTDYRFLNKHQDFFQKEITSQTEEFLPVYNDHYANFQVEDLGFSDYPPLLDQFGGVKLKKEHQDLLLQSIEGYQTDAPLLTTVEEGKLRQGALFGENTWQWRAKAYRDKETFEEYDEFIGKLVQYLASNQRRERLSIDFNSFYNSGDQILFQAHYFDENYSFDPRAKLSVQVTDKKSQQTQDYPFLLKNNRYEVNLSSLSAGDYKFRVRVEGTNLSKGGEFTIIDFDIEKQFLNANLTKLKRIASDEVYFLDRPDQLLQKLMNKKKFKPIQKSTTTTAPIVDWWYLLLIIAGSLAVEWFMRKYHGLI